jgi:hypothetical protein
VMLVIVTQMTGRSEERMIRSLASETTGGIETVVTRMAEVAAAAAAEEAMTGIAATMIGIKSVTTKTGMTDSLTGDV